MNDKSLLEHQIRYRQDGLNCDCGKAMKLEVEGVIGMFPDLYRCECGKVKIKRFYSNG